MQSVVSVRGQTVIPKELREKLGIKPHTRLDWTLKNGTLIAYPIPEDPVAALRGVLKGLGSTAELLAERGAERDKEEAELERMIKEWRSSS